MTAPSVTGTAPGPDGRIPGGPSAGAVTASRSDMHRTLLLAVDALAAVVAVRVCGGTALGAWAWVGVVVVVDLLDQHQTHRLNLSALDELPASFVRGIAVAGLLTTVGLAVCGAGLSRLCHGAGFLVTALVYLTLAVTGRGVVYTRLRRMRASGRLTELAVVVGAGPVGAQLGWRMRQHPEYGLIPFGFLDDTPASASQVLPAPLVGHVADLPALVTRHGVRHVLVTCGPRPGVDLVDLLRCCDRLRCEIFVVPRLFEMGVAARPATDHLWGLPLIRLNRAAHRGYPWALKRIFDATFAAIALLLTAPLLAGIALAVRREVGRPILFRQVRTGLDGEPFQLLKFRTLDPPRKDEPTGFCVVDAARVGPVGRFLRRSSLDELPQLWNVLRGQMSLVGPRPEQLDYTRQFAEQHPRYRGRLRVPAGVTGLAQVHDLRGDTPIEDRVCFDNFYIEHWSLWQDIKILVRTVASVIGMRGR